MAHLYSCSYIVGHETTRKPATTGEAAPTGYPVAPTRQNRVGRGALAERVQKFRGTLARRAQAERLERASPQGYSWASSPTVRSPESTVSKVSLTRTLGSRILDRPLDLATHCGAHREALSCVVSPQPRMATVVKYGVELPEARASRPPAGRKSDRTLETDPLARDKKKPQNLGPIWCFWMKVAFSLFPISSVPGHPEARHLISTIGFGKTKYRPLLPSASHHISIAWACTSDFTNAVSRGAMSRVSFAICSNISEDLSCCYGTAG